jgi:hypothetical protein
VLCWFSTVENTDSFDLEATDDVHTLGGLRAVNVSASEREERLMIAVALMIAVNRTASYFQSASVSTLCSRKVDTDEYSDVILVYRFIRMLELPLVFCRRRSIMV